MVLIPQETIDRILDATDIVEVVSERVQLKKAGRNFKACCPFHAEKTPSFMVSPDKQIYHCFGCGSGGNAIGFVMKYDNIDFPEAVRLLAAKAGIDIPRYERRDPAAATLASTLYELNRSAVSFYAGMLKSPKGAKALDYLKSRGIKNETIDIFGLGWAPDEWESFQAFARARKIPQDIVRKAGFAMPSEKGKGDYDRFRSRIMFPIFNERDACVAFGGRVMDNSEPKYMNSPETAVYNKGSVLYGLNFSRKGIREKGCALIVEGYVDVIIPYQAGATNVVASSGTAFTQHQASLLKKYTGKAVIVFDADKAGQAASLRGLDILVAGGMDVRVAELPEGEDPDTVVKKKGAAFLDEVVGKAKDLFDYKLDLLEKTASPAGGAVEKAKTAGEMLETIEKIENAIIKSEYLRKLAARLGVDENALRQEMKKIKGERRYAVFEEKEKPRECRKSELYLLGLAILDKGRFRAVMDDVGAGSFANPDVKKALSILGEIYERDGEINPAKFLERFEEGDSARITAVQAIARTEMSPEDARETVYRDCVECMRKENFGSSLKLLNALLKKAQQEKNTAKIMELVAKIDGLCKQNGPSSRTVRNAA